MRIVLDAHSLDKEFEAQLAAANIRVVDRIDEPWSVVFEGEQDALIDFVQEHWGQLTFEDAVCLVVSSELKEK